MFIAWNVLPGALVQDTNLSDRDAWGWIRVIGGKPRGVKRMLQQSLVAMNVHQSGQP